LSRFADRNTTQGRVDDDRPVDRYHLRRCTRALRRETK
jgi:hypothetical protein